MRQAVLDADENRLRETLRQHQPARQLGRQGGLAFPAFADHHHVTLAQEEPLEDQQLPAAANEIVWRLGRHARHRFGIELLHLFDRLAARQLGYQLRVERLLEKHRHEEVPHPQLAVESAAAHRVLPQPTLGGQHRAAHRFAGGELAVEGLDETPSGLDQHRMAHRHHRGHPAFEQAAPPPRPAGRPWPPPTGRPRAPPAAPGSPAKKGGGQLRGIDQLAAPLFQQVLVGRIFET